MSMDPTSLKRVSPYKYAHHTIYIYNIIYHDIRLVTKSTRLQVAIISKVYPLLCTSNGIISNHALRTRLQHVTMIEQGNIAPRIRHIICIFNNYKFQPTLWHQPPSIQNKIKYAPPLID